MNPTEATKIVLMFTAVVPNQKLTDTQLQDMSSVWHMTLQDIPYALAQAAALQLLRSRTISVLPQPGEIVTAITDMQQAIEPSASEGWGEVMRAIHKHGYVDEAGALASMSPKTRCIVERMGWQEICDSEAGKGVTRGQFIKLYEQERERDKTLDTIPESVQRMLRGAVKQLPSASIEQAADYRPLTREARG